MQGEQRLARMSSSSSSPSLYESEEELQHMPLAPPPWKNRRCLSKQLSMCETPRDIAWEKRRRQIIRQERKKNGINQDSEDLTDEDLNELKGSIELGFGFNEEDGQTLCNTLPALDLYFAVNRQFSTSPVSTPGGSSSSLDARSSSFESPKSESDAWKICSPGDDPQQVKTKLRHWAQAVACSVMQSF
ncbi:uncharacterized protein LOC112022656 [Quercus suber]|uniref:uncharacterized protein LOC112022656 n=1 Tax=Quercus suber TaxID=58331 RepID=UPI000CE26F71|nr:uncharacterized protein LOC112022656 [Quercus suber]